MTPYALAQLVNEHLALAGCKIIPAQMIYNYVRKGFIKATQVNVDGKLTYHIKVDDANAWMVKYLTKRGITINS